MLLPQVFVSFCTMTCFLVMTLLRNHGKEIAFRFRKAHKGTLEVSLWVASEEAHEAPAWLACWM